MTEDVKKDMENRELWFLNALVEKLRDEMVSRLSELADTKARGRLTFTNGSTTLRRLGHADCADHVGGFRDFVTRSQFEEKRNKEISHKEFVIDWEAERAPIRVKYALALRGLAMAVRVMKRMDEQLYGRLHAQFMWSELRKRRYSTTMLPRAAYMIAEHILIPEAIRARIIQQEIREGRFHQEVIETVVNGVNVQVYASRKWGAVNLGGHLLVLPQYPLQKLEKIDGPGIAVDPAWLQDPINDPTQHPADSSSETTTDGEA
jgi:hypothetical protein